MGIERPSAGGNMLFASVINWHDADTHGIEQIQCIFIISSFLEALSLSLFLSLAISLSLRFSLSLYISFLVLPSSHSCLVRSFCVVSICVCMQTSDLHKWRATGDIGWRSIYRSWSRRCPALLVYRLTGLSCVPFHILYAVCMPVPVIFCVL